MNKMVIAFNKEVIKLKYEKNMENLIKEEIQINLKIMIKQFNESNPPNK